MAIVAILALLGAGPFAPTPRVIPPSPEGRISFVRSDTQNNTRTIFVVNPDGTNQQQVTSDLLIESLSNWSPDGKYLVAQANVSGISKVVRIAVGADNKASETVQLTSDINADSVIPSWSPDGKMVSFQSKKDGGDYQVFVMNGDGSNKRRLSDGNGYAGQATWSPDSKSLAYLQGPDSKSANELYVVSVDSGAPKAITKLGALLTQPVWTRDGKSVAFIERSQSVVVVPATGGDPRTLYDAGASDTIKNLAASPAGDLLSFYRVVTQGGNTGSFVQTVPLAGGTPALVSKQSSDAYYGAWSPDGKRLAWADNVGGTHRIVVSDVDGNNLKVVSSGAGDDYQPVWGSPVTPESK